MDDSKIIEKVLDGVTDNFEYLIIKYQNQIYAIVLSLVKDIDVAADIVQDVFLTAFEKLSTLKDRKLFYPWIKRISINKSFHHFNRSKKNINIDEETMDYFATNRNSASNSQNISSRNNIDYSDNNNDVWNRTYKSPEAILINNEVKKYIKQFVDSLPDRLRIIVVLREIDGLSYEEIAENLNIPVGTVRSRLHYAREYLKNRLERQGLADGLQEIS